MDRLRRFLVAGVTCFVDLTEPAELPSYEPLLPLTTPEGRRIEYGRMRRGDAVGEVAMFSHKRSADVEVTADASLLRFDEGDLERIARRYPRIAAKVNRNLNQILARRVMNTARALH